MNTQNLCVGRTNSFFSSSLLSHSLYLCHLINGVSLHLDYRDYRRFEWKCYWNSIAMSNDDANCFPVPCDKLADTKSINWLPVHLIQNLLSQVLFQPWLFYRRSFHTSTFNKMKLTKLTMIAFRLLILVRLLDTCFVRLLCCSRSQSLHFNLLLLVSIL